MRVVSAGLIHCLPSLPPSFPFLPSSRQQLWVGREGNAVGVVSCGHVSLPPSFPPSPPLYPPDMLIPRDATYTCLGPNFHHRLEGDGINDDVRAYQWICLFSLLNAEVDDAQLSSLRE